MLVTDDARMQEEGGLFLRKDEVFALITYAQAWQQRYVEVES